MKEVFKKIITDFHEQQIPKLIPRDVQIPADSGSLTHKGKKITILPFWKWLLTS